MISSSTALQTRHLPTGQNRGTHVCSLPCPHISTPVQNASSTRIRHSLGTRHTPRLSLRPHCPLQPRPQPAPTSRSRYPNPGTRRPIKMCSVLGTSPKDPLTARWCAITSLLRALLNSTRCLTEDGKELTRVCIIDYESGIVVFDKLVKLPKPVMNYLAKYRFPFSSSRCTLTTDHLDGPSQRHLSLWPRRPSSSSKPKATPHPSSSVIPSNLTSKRSGSAIPAASTLHSSTTTPTVDRSNRSNPDSHGPPKMVSARDPDTRACVDSLRLKIQNGAGFGEFKPRHENSFERMARACRRVARAM